ncbi:MAG: HAD-IA family hydrolase [Verrucomicrobia bacterium]|nr:HAD-IA family hydrolase [Verrucomicrobiota bacterium]
MIRVVTFDAAGTLIRLLQPPGVIYAEEARLFGYILDPVRLQGAFRSTWKTFAPPPESATPCSDDDREWWRRLVVKTMEEARYRIIPFDDYFSTVYRAFARPGVWELLPDVPVILTELRRLGIRLGVISNFDRRLYEILSGLGVIDAFEHIVISSEIGVRKPAARIFQVAARRFNVETPEMLHVGDEDGADLRGARAAGLNALLVDHEVSRLSGIVSCLSGEADSR